MATNFIFVPLLFLYSLLSLNQKGKKRKRNWSELFKQVMTTEQDIKLLMITLPLEYCIEEEEEDKKNFNLKIRKKIQETD